MILVDREGALVTITINRPQSLNTLTHELILALIETIKEWSAGKGIRLMILTGSGDRAFIGGVDVRAMMDLDPEGAERFITDLHRCFLAIRQAEPIVLASINGFALGGGLEMAASCDLRLASDNARFGMPEVRVGIPSVIEASILPRLIGLGRAAELVYRGEMIDAAEAETDRLDQQKGPSGDPERGYPAMGRSNTPERTHGYDPAKKIDRPMDGIKPKRVHRRGYPGLPGMFSDPGTAGGYAGLFGKKAPCLLKKIDQLKGKAISLIHKV